MDFYAFDDEFIVSLSVPDFIELSSKGTVFDKNQDIVIDKETKKKSYADILALSYKTMLEDAETRKSSFLSILKKGI